MAILVLTWWMNGRGTERFCYKLDVEYQIYLLAQDILYSGLFSRGKISQI